ncbi:MAG: cytochrome c biogenesis protein CcsA, partial [Rhodothermales bacterium]|nr:cytochrome c biogenesis protein CcsA [Rhodothermales bacterium]
YEPTVMTVIGLCQAFLLSMIVGLKLGGLPIGSSPFITLAEKFPEAPMLAAGLVPADGSGLNDLLQNYWMVIHPPTLFAGFAAMIVPFAFAVSALWKKQYTQWVRPALPWALLATVILGIGIAMGGYWAYVTLSFGGYWAWDPVENSSLVPWLFGIAAIHTMIVQKKSGNSHKASIFLCILAYMFVVYSTFLTRSGILGDVSVHSFVDLGLYNQLLLWILTMGALGFGLMIYRYRELPKPPSEPNIMSREFMIFCGAMLLSATAVVITVGTSSPIIGNIFRDNPSTVPIAFYNSWSLPLAIMFVFLIGIGQLFWWTKINVATLNKLLLKPLALAVVSTIAVLVFTPFTTQSTNVASVAPTTISAGIGDSLSSFWAGYGNSILLLLLLFVTFFALFGNAQVMWKIGRGNPKLAGGAFSHIGFAVMILGIIASSGFSNPVSVNNGIELGDGKRDNFVIAAGEVVSIDGYSIHYQGKQDNVEGRPEYPINITDPSGDSYTMSPVVYKSNSDQWIQHPDVKVGFKKDLFVAVTPNEMFELGDEQSITMQKGDTLLVGEDEFQITFLDFEVIDSTEFATDSTEISVGAVLDIVNLKTGDEQQVRPVYLIEKDGSVKYLETEVLRWNMSVSFVGMNVTTGAINLVISGVTVKQQDWIVVQALEKPLINLVWIGIIMFSIGFVISIVRRAGEQKVAISQGRA